MPVLEHGAAAGRDELNETRSALGLPPQERFHGGISERLAIVAPSRSWSTRGSGRRART